METCYIKTDLFDDYRLPLKGTDELYNLTKVKYYNAKDAMDILNLSNHKFAEMLKRNGIKRWPCKRVKCIKNLYKHIEMFDEEERELIVIMYHAGLDMVHELALNMNFIALRKKLVNMMKNKRNV